MPARFWAEGRTMSQEHKDKLAEGRRKAQLRKQADGIERAVAFYAWLKSGTVLDEGYLGRCPDIPTDADCQAARDAGRI